MYTLRIIYCDAMEDRYGRNKNLENSVQYLQGVLSNTKVMSKYHKTITLGFHKTIIDENFINKSPLLG